MHETKATASAEATIEKRPANPVLDELRRAVAKLADGAAKGERFRIQFYAYPDGVTVEQLEDALKEPVKAHEEPEAQTKVNGAS